MCNCNAGGAEGVCRQEVRRIRHLVRHSEERIWNPGRTRASAKFLPARWRIEYSRNSSARDGEKIRAQLISKPFRLEQISLRASSRRRNFFTTQGRCLACSAEWDSGCFRGRTTRLRLPGSCGASARPGRRGRLPLRELVCRSPEHVCPARARQAQIAGVGPSHLYSLFALRPLIESGAAIFHAQAHFPTKPA
jgi:hypothetical protein